MAVVFLTPAAAELGGGPPNVVVGRIEPVVLPPPDPVPVEPPVCVGEPDPVLVPDPCCTVLVAVAVPAVFVPVPVRE